MFLKVATTVTLIASCLGHAPAYDERGSNEAISTQSFNRDDIPISYKYTAIHVYSTQKPIDEDDVIRPQKHQNSGYHVVQYAPLVENTTKNSTRFTKMVSDSNKVGNKANFDIKYDKLEPRKHSVTTNIDDPTKIKYFVSGHNIEVKRSSNRNPGHNAIYQNNPDNLKDTIHEINNNWKGYAKHGDSSPGKEVTKKSQRNFNYLKHEPFAWMLEQNEKPDTYTYIKGETNLQQNQINSAPPHTHRMRINVGRMNGHAQIIAREIVIGDILKNLAQPNNHANLKSALRLNGEQRTLLYPKRPKLY